MNYIIYCDNEKIENFYVYDQSKHVKKGELVYQDYRCGNLVFRSATYRDKNKFSRKNGCLTSLNRSYIGDFLKNNTLIQLPVDINSRSKFVLAFLGEDGKYLGLKIRFKCIPSVNTKNGKTTTSGRFTMDVTCQDHDWIKKHSDLKLLDEKIKENGYYFNEFISEKKDNDLRSVLDLSENKF